MLKFNPMKKLLLIFSAVILISCESEQQKKSKADNTKYIAALEQQQKSVKEYSACLKRVLALMEAGEDEMKASLTVDKMSGGTCHCADSLKAKEARGKK